VAFARGTRLGVYEILTLIGEGGMGEVYRARDTRLGRDVAIKVLPSDVTADRDRRTRFEREAHVLASLNHPNIAHIHGIDDSSGAPALVMELVEGPTLADRIAKGPIPLDEALPIAKQIAEALETAHEQGIIHRDLKPANIKVRPDGTVKVLDFGLAKAFEPLASAGGDATHSPTLSIHATQAGIILGTAAYMSPEQAKGRPADKRSDVWAFGCVLFEMLTGCAAFGGDTFSDTIAMILEHDPKWNRLPANTPGSVRVLLARCLEKDSRRRLRDVGDARIELADAIAGGKTPTDSAAIESAPIAAAWNGRVWRVRSATILLLASAVLLVAALFLWPGTTRRVSEHVQPVRFTIEPALNQPLAISPFGPVMALSPDGLQLAYIAGIAYGAKSNVVVRGLDQLDLRPLATGVYASWPFFSPDSRWIGFVENSDLKKVPVTGGPVVTIARNLGVVGGASWGEDDNIVFATTDPKTGLLRVPASGGEPKVLTTPDASRGEGDHWYASVLPGVRGVLFTIMADRPEDRQIAVLDLKTGQRKTLIHGGSFAQYVTSGHVVFLSSGALRAARFDLATLRLLGDPVSVVDPLAITSTGIANYAISQSGTLVYVPGQTAVASPRSLVWIDRAGRETPVPVPPGSYVQVRLSPDGTRAALTIEDTDSNIWILDLGHETITRLTFGQGSSNFPVWSSDGRRIVFSSTRGSPTFNLYAQAADGSGTVERLTTSGNQQFPRSIIDARHVIGTEVFDTTQNDVVVYRDTDTQGRWRTEPLVRTPAKDNGAVLSVDGHYLAYESDESGRFEVYVRPFPRVNEGRWQVSTSGGSDPVWSRSGQELFYVDPSGSLMAAPVQLSPSTFSSGRPARLIDLGSDNPVYDVSPDGERFLVVKNLSLASQSHAPARMVVVLNWLEELKQRVPTR
jgi:serine/threonine-protein kinase